MLVSHCRSAPLRTLTTLACGAVSVTGACARPGVTPDPAPRSPDSVHVFTGGRVIVGDGSVIDAATFVVRDDLIIEVGPAGAVGDFFGYADHLELVLFVRLGMTPSQAIVAATQRAVEAFGLTHVGTVAAGQSADFVVLDANPLDDIRNTRQMSRVYLRGEEIDRDSLRSAWMR